MPNTYLTLCGTKMCGLYDIYLHSGAIHALPICLHWLHSDSYYASPHKILFLILHSDSILQTPLRNSS